MTKLDMRIQRKNNLNNIYFDPTVGPGNGIHSYFVVESNNETEVLTEIDFQNGPRNEVKSISGVMDSDLLEIVRHRLQQFQSGEYATRENALAITHIEEALMWMAKSAEEDEYEVLGTYNK